MHREHKTYSISVSFMIQQKGPGKSFSRMFSKNSLLVALSNEVLRQGTTSSRHVDFLENHFVACLGVWATW